MTKYLFLCSVLITQGQHVITNLPKKHVITNTSHFKYIAFGTSLVVDAFRAGLKHCPLEMQGQCVSVMQEIHANYLTELLLALLIFYASV